jgi:hypothetical protein
MVVDAIFLNGVMLHKVLQEHMEVKLGLSTRIFQKDQSRPCNALVVLVFALY